MNNSKEGWLPIPEFHNYEISDDGQVRRIDTKREIKSYKMTNGYMRIFLGKNNGRQVHCLVMAAFVGKKPEGYQVNHKNGIKADNRLENLEYLTQKENMRHAVDVLGFSGRTRIVSDAQCEVAVHLRAKGKKWREIGEHLNIPFGTVYMAVRAYKKRRANAF
jgi:hypothetical protein